MKCSLKVLDNKTWRVLLFTLQLWFIFIKEYNNARSNVVFMVLVLYELWSIILNMRFRFCIGQFHSSVDREVFVLVLSPALSRNEAHLRLAINPTDTCAQSKPLLLFHSTVLSSLTPSVHSLLSWIQLTAQLSGQPIVFFNTHRSEVVTLPSSLMKFLSHFSFLYECLRR